jgi:hypothetical protein
MCWTVMPCRKAPESQLYLRNDCLQSYQFSPISPIDRFAALSHSPRQVLRQFSVLQPRRKCAKNASLFDVAGYRRNVRPKLPHQTSSDVCRIHSEAAAALDPAAPRLFK